MTINYKDTKAFTEKAAKFLDELAKKKNAKSFVRLIDATDVFVKNLPSKNMGSYFTPCSMLRLYADKVPELAKLDRILYMDYDVVCRGDISEFYNPTITTVIQPKSELANISVELLIDLINNKVENKHVILETLLVERESTIKK